MKALHFIVYIILILFVAIGWYFAHNSPDFFAEYFVKEDAWVENLTAVFLFITSLLLLFRAFRFASLKNGLACLGCLLMAAVFFFGAGEEISWGQRIFKIETSEFFNANNTQREINIHNLEFKGIKLNKLIFSQLLSIVLFLYLFVFKFLYARIPSIQNLFDRFAIPVHHWHQSLMIVFLLLLIVLIPSDRKWEMLEFIFAILFLLIVAFPFNRSVFVK